MKSSRLLFVVIVLVALVAAVVALSPGREKAREVDLAAVELRPVFQSFVTASGEIVAARFADIGSSVMGNLVELAVTEGQAVEAGEVLARIDPVQARSEAESFAAQVKALEAELVAAEAREIEARQAVERNRRLSADGVLADADLDRAVATADSALAQVESARRRVAQGRAQLDRARDALAKTEITAPMDGVVTRLAVREGEMVVIGVQNQPGTILMTLSDLSALDAEVQVAEADVLRLALDQRASVRLEALPEREFPGRTVEIGASALPLAGGGAAAREFRVVVRLDEPDLLLKPGLTCDVEILAEELRDILTLPLQSVVLRSDPEEGDQTGVFVVEDGRATFVPVETGILGGLDIEVRGLEEGMQVVAGPYQALRELEEGEAVRGRAEAAR